MTEITELYGRRNPLLFKEENILGYRPGGYHPILLGDTLKDGRYKIYHKLGHGGFSTVWAAKDFKCERWVSIKINVAEKTHQNQELLHLRAISALTDDDPGSKYIVQLLDDFLLDGPNGSHLCLVSELLGPTINTLMESYYEFKERPEAELVLGISTQVLQALEFLHENGFAHGDLSVRNLVFNTSRLAHVTEEELFKVLGLPEAEEVTRLDGRPLGEGVPHQLIKSTLWIGWPYVEDGEDEDDEDDPGDEDDDGEDDDGEDDEDEDDEDEVDLDIRLIDFGEAFTRDSIPEKIAQTGGMQAPETIFTDKFDYRLDLWRAGLIVSLLPPSHPFFERFV